MRKALAIFLLTLTFACSVERIGSKQEPIYGKSKIEYIIQNIENNNITNNSFYIEKGEISIKNKDEIKRFIFTVKHKIPDTYLISVRNSFGFEGARIFISNDTVLINDRISKRLLYGKTNNVENILGLPLSFLKMAFGDFIIDTDSSNRKNEQINNRIIISQYISGMTLKSIIHPKIYKMNAVECGKGITNETISFKYSKYSKSKEHVPEIIEIKNEKEAINVRIRIKKLQSPWSGEIEFIPGNGYKKEEIK